MGLDEVVEEILDEADRHASEIEREADDRAAEIVQEAERDAEETRQDALESAEKETEALERRELSSAKLEARMKRLKARKELLARTKDRAYEMLEELSGDRREGVIGSLLDAAEDEMPEGTVYAAPKDEDLVKDRVGDRFGGTIDAAAGLRVEEEGVVLDLTLDSMLEDEWENSLPEVSAELFGD